MAGPLARPPPRDGLQPQPRECGQWCRRIRHACSDARGGQSGADIVFACSHDDPSLESCSANMARHGMKRANLRRHTRSAQSAAAGARWPAARPALHRRAGSGGTSARSTARLPDVRRRCGAFDAIAAAMAFARPHAAGRERRGQLGRWEQSAIAGL